jgi:ubiquinone/menaquinone biosynthesis C-methylase UbiE
MSVTLDSVTRVLSQRLPMYKARKPVYQTAMLASIEAALPRNVTRLLDIGGGTGVIAQAMHELFGIPEVVSLDVYDRFLPGLGVTTATYDGRTLPFPADRFDAVVINNVLHHVEPADRLPLLRECARVAPRGVVVIKDHLAQGPLDHVRLGALDLLGNVPFSGMLRARYLSAREWASLAEAAGYRSDVVSAPAYRGRLFAISFPNELEITMRWTRV